jgi:hypothetical protein
MSIRIHEPAKRYNMESKDRLALLKERGYQTIQAIAIQMTG